MPTEEKARALARVETIANLSPIEGADRIEKARILGWDVVVKKGEFKIGDKCVYFEIDSILPKTEWSNFLSDKNNPQKAIRLKTIRLRKQLSQGLALPINFVFPNEDNFEVGEDVTTKLNIIKYEAPIPASLKGEIQGYFPSFLYKTDEERIQNIFPIISQINGKLMYISVKMDGTSSTYFYNPSIENSFGVCGRNIWYKPTVENTYWKIAKKYDIENKLKKYYEKYGQKIAIQGEICGPSIQSNKIGLKDHELFVFNIFDIDKKQFYNYLNFISICKELELQTVPILNDNYVFTGHETIEELLKMAEGVYINGHTREGIVIRPLIEEYSELLKGRLSFKIINNNFLEETGE